MNSLWMWLIAAGIMVLLLLLWLVRGSIGRHRDNWSDLRQVDVAAFRNLLVAEDNEFLRNSLTSHHYRQVRRARARAMQEYLMWIAENCALLGSLLRSSVLPGDPSSTRQVSALVLRALHVRLASLGLWMLLWLEYAAPDADMRPMRVLKRYEDFMRSAEGYLTVSMPRPILDSGRGRAG